MRVSINSSIRLTALPFVSLICVLQVFAAEPVTFKKNDHICYIGNTTADRMQHHAWLETYLHAKYPELNLTFRNLGFAADEVQTRPRSANFGDPDQWLTKCEADTVFCFFGYNEALRGETGLDSFKQQFTQMLEGMLAQKYNGESALQIVVFSPIAHENLRNQNLPDGSENNRKLALYTDTMQEICKSKGITFIDIFHPTQQLYATAEDHLTMNGIHLLDHGNRELAQVIMKKLDSNWTPPSDGQITDLRDAVLEKNYYWFSRYRVVDGYNVYGGRSKLAWFGQSNADVMKREMEIFDVMTANRDQKIWAVARGEDHEVKDDNIPEELIVKTNKQGPLEGGAFPYIGPEEAIEYMKIHADMQVNVFASEEMFPRLINPVQMAVDTDSRLWASIWPSYPHWNPTKPRKDALVILPDEDQNGVADDCIVFADELNSITGFEFWGGGVLVAAPPEIWFLKDTDGDDKADVKIRMLQGVSSADTHHSANAMLVGPDGWLYWSRGVFNVTNFETPTQTYRSGQTGVHRFNPRTFEVEFHFPIGPNPHGDVVDRWGYQFASDGTSGTGSYINIGKGVGNKQWYKKRVRPVPATGILSSEHFPDELNDNFLICNAIGFLGVLQHEVRYNGADITAEEIDPIVVSQDPNFRPSDLEIGGDGALYIADWHNALIGHMQHNMRDPNRDETHGRVYRVTYKGRPLSKPVKMKDKPIGEVCQNFFSRTNSVRYRARLELSGRETEDIIREVNAFAENLNPANAAYEHDEAQALLESLWVFEEHRVPNMDLLRKTFQAAEPRVRAAAIRTLGHWAGRVSNWEDILLVAARDDANLVRAEAAKAAVEFDGLAASEAIFEVANRPTDPELDVVVKYATGSINLGELIAEAQKNNNKLSTAARQYLLSRASVAQLSSLPPADDIHRIILSRPEAKQEQMASALAALANSTGTNALDLLMGTIDDHRASSDVVLNLGKLLIKQPVEELSRVRDQIETLATQGETPGIKQLGYAAWVAAAGPGDAFIAASKTKESLRDFLDAVPVVDESVRGELFDKVAPLMFDLPTHLEAEGQHSSLQENGIQVEYYFPHQTNVAVETLDKLEPKATGIVPEIVMEVPQRKEKDRFALRFTGNLFVPKSGKYTIYIASDDGSRIYLDEDLFINHDGLHGMTEKKRDVDLSAGPHKLVVTYYDNGGGDGLRVQWSGPGISKQNIPSKNLAVAGAETIHDVAIRAMEAIPGHAEEKFLALAKLVKSNRSQPAAIHALRTIPEAAWPKPQIKPLLDNLIGYLSAMPARYRTGAAGADATALAKSLAAKLNAVERDAALERLQNLDVRLIAIGTVSHRMIYDKEQIVVQAGKPVEFRFSNTDAMPHNFCVVQPGSLQEVGELAEETGREPDAQDRHFIPVTNKVLVSSKLLQPGESQAISFEVPTKPGVYPYVCTYPGHWRRMYGALYVVDNFEAYQTNPESYLANADLEVKDDLLKMMARSREWTFDELIGSVKTLPEGRSFEVGKQLFKVASCVGCHRLDNEGVVFGPDLAKLDPKKRTTEHILRSIIEPSKDIEDKYRSHAFVLSSGKIVTGMIVEETPETLSVIIDPLAKGKPTVIKKDEIDAQKQSELSMMPKGLLNKLTEEEILDLIAFVYAGGDKKHMMYHGHHHH